MPAHIIGSGLRMGGISSGSNPNAYADQIKAVAPSNLIQFLRGAELSGTTAADYSGNSRTGSYSNVTLNGNTGPDGQPAPQYVAASSSLLNLYSSSLNAAYSQQEASFMIWYKVASGAWTDSTQRTFQLLYSGGSNYYYLSKSSVNNQVVVDTRAGGTSKGATISGLYNTAWNCIIVTISKSNDRLRVYHNFVKQGSDVTGLGTYTGALSSTKTVLGSFDTTSPSIKMEGGLALHALWNKELSAAEVESLRPPATGATLAVFDGDSLTVGSGSSGGNTYPAQYLALVGGGGWESYNVGINGQTLAGMAAASDVDGKFDVVRPARKLYVWGGTNDMRAGTDDTTTYGRLVTYCNARKAIGWQIYVMTCLPRTGDVLPDDATFETRRLAFNTAVRTNYATFADKLVDIALDSRIGDAGDNTDTTYYSGDNVHLNNTGYGVVAALTAAVG